MYSGACTAATSSDRRRPRLDEIRESLVQDAEPFLPFGMVAGRVQLGERPVADERDQLFARTWAGPTSPGVGQPRRTSASRISAWRISSTWRAPSRAAGREPPERRPADEDGPRAERERLRDVRAPPDAAVEVDLRTAADGLDDLGQRVQGRGDAVELPPAVVGDDDAGRTVLARERGVLGREDALEHERKRALGAKPLEVAPGDARVDDGRRACRGSSRRRRAPAAGWAWAGRWGA